MRTPLLPPIIREDWFRKAVALIFAVLLWFYVKGQLRDVETFHDVPVVLSYDRTAICAEKDTATVNVSVRGSRQQLQKLRGSDLRVTAEIKEAEIQHGKSAYDLRVTPECVETPTGITVVGIDPSLQQIAVDRMETKSGVPIRVRYGGRLPEGYQISRCTVIPSQVDVRAPAALLQDVQELTTDLVPLDETLTVGFEVEKRISSASPRVIPGIATVHVQVEIAKQATHSYQDLPVAVLNNPLLQWDVVEPMPLVKVAVRGMPENLKNVDPASIRPFIDLSSYTVPGRYRCRVEVWTSGAAGVAVESVSPSVVDVTIVEQGSDFMFSQLQPENRPILPPSAMPPASVPLSSPPVSVPLDSSVKPALPEGSLMLENVLPSTRTIIIPAPPAKSGAVQ